MKYFEVSFNIQSKTINIYEMDYDIEHEVIAEEEAYECFDDIIGESNVSKEEAIQKIDKYLTKEFNKAWRNWMNWRYADKDTN